MRCPFLESIVLLGYALDERIFENLLRFAPHHAALSPIGSGQLTAIKRKFARLANFPNFLRQRSVAKLWVASILLLPARLRKLLLIAMLNSIATGHFIFLFICQIANYIFPRHSIVFFIHLLHFFAKISNYMKNGV